MKIKHLLLSLMVFMSITGYSQTFIYEDFSSGQMPPTDWTITGLATQWSTSQSSNAGGTAPEAMFTYTNQNTTTRLISPSLDLTGLTSISLNFRHYYDFYSNPAPKLGVATRANPMASWSSVWEISPTGNVGPIQVNIDISNSSVGSSQFQFCFYLTGNMYNLDFWYLDDVILINPLNIDGFLVSLNQTPSYFQSPAQVKGSILNSGVTPITDALIAWQLDGGEIYNTQITGLSVATLESFDFACDVPMDPPIGSYDLAVWIKAINGVADDDQGNDTLRKAVSKVCYSVPRKPFFEEFTSSTCGPCASFNTSFVPWCDSHENDITLLKYQMDWPGSGDPYYTEEGGVRKDYYGVGWVPWLICNGGFVNTDMPSVQSAFDFGLTQIGLMDIEATHSLNGHIVTVNTSVLPFANIPGCHLYIAVFENVTHNNVASNGETSFEHVMMKMIPDATGIPIDLVDRTPFTYTNTIDLTGTNVEEWDDLGVVVWMQNYLTREMYQSVYSVEDGSLGTDNQLSDILVDQSSLYGFSPSDFEYIYGVPEGTTMIPEVQGIPANDNETVIVVPALTIPGTTTIDVFAENNVDHNLYTVTFLFNTGLNETHYPEYSIFPNPARDKLFIYGAENALVEFFSSTGQPVKTIYSFTGKSINLVGFSKGIYTLKITLQDQTVIVKKIIVL